MLVRLPAHILHTHCEPGTTVAADVRIWLLGQIFEQEETRFLITINRSSKESPETIPSVRFQFVEVIVKLLFGFLRCIIIATARAARTVRQMSSLHFFNELISIRRSIYEMGLH